MESNDFRRHAHEMVDWMADYLDGVERFPVKPRVEPGQIAAQLPAGPPLEGEPMDRIWADFQAIALPGMTHWQHPSFFAYFPANSSRPSVLAEMLTATMAAQCMSWETSPAATEIEGRMLEWLRQLIGLPEGFVGSIQDTASTATLCAILAARERATDFSVNESGIGDGETLTAYCSAEAHSSVEKNIKIAGIGRSRLRKISVDADYAMIPEHLDHAIRDDVAAGNKPVCTVATIGTTGASGIDPLRRIGEVCRSYGVWLHVDAAWAGSAMVLPDLRWMIDGVELADSFVFNPHKWLLTNFDCSAFYVRNAGDLVRTFEILPEYLKTKQGSSVTNYRDWGIQLGRRFRALKLWFVLRSFGVNGLRRMIQSHIDMAAALARKIDDCEDFDLLRRPILSLLCFRYHPHPSHGGLDDEALDGLNEKLLYALNDSGALYLTQTRLGGKYAIRFVVGQPQTTQEHVDKAWDTIVSTARGMEEGKRG